eukprot:1676143-Rhodomonas_salina.3
MAAGCTVLPFWPTLLSYALAMRCPVALYLALLPHGRQYRGLGRYRSILPYLSTGHHVVTA